MNKFKSWYKRNKKTLAVVGFGVVGGVCAVYAYRGINSAIHISKAKMLMVVENKLKLVPDGDVIDIIVGNRSDDFSRTVVSKQWTKLDGEVLYLGKVLSRVELSDDEKIANQLSRIGRSITHAINKISKD